MFCANTRPVPVATTDFGEIAPVIVRSNRSGRSIAGVGGVVVVVLRGSVDVVVGSTRVVVLGSGRAETFDPPPESLPDARSTIAAAPSATTSADAASRR